MIFVDAKMLRVNYFVHNMYFYELAMGSRI